jgi:hypothetical protein
MAGIIETLDQEIMWYGKYGQPYVVDTMETSHIQNVLDMLRHKSYSLFQQELWLERQNLARFGATGQQIALFDKERMRLCDETDTLAWLNAKPLIQRLEHVLRLRESVDGEVVNTEIETTRPALEAGRG